MHLILFDIQMQLIPFFVLEQNSENKLFLKKLFFFFFYALGQ